jgi:hypothetical protein
MIGQTVPHYRILADLPTDLTSAESPALFTFRGGALGMPKTHTSSVQLHAKFLPTELVRDVGARQGFI